MRKKVRVRIIKAAILLVGFPLTYWAFPAGIVGTPPGDWSLEQAYRAGASLVLLFWTIIFAVNVEE